MPLERLKQRLRDRITTNTTNVASGAQEFQDTLVDIMLAVLDEFRSERLEETDAMMSALTALTTMHAELLAEVRGLRTDVKALAMGRALEAGRDGT